MENHTLEKSELREILDQSGIVALTDAFGNYKYVNKIWQKTTGISAEEAIGKNVESLMEGSGVMLALRTGRVMTGEVFIRTSYKKDVSAIIKYRPLINSEKNIIGCLIHSVFESLEEAQNFTASFDQMLEEFDYMKNSPDYRLGAKYTTKSIIGDSQAMKDVKEQIYIAGASNAACLIEGETGTGKELVAHAIHNASMRSAFPFITVNCSAIPENLMESEFFGYEEGSFTGGLKGGRAGKFEKAHLGSMFLDEINAMSLSMQPKLLRALQEKEIERIGGIERIPVDVRIIAASNKGLKQLYESGAFRQDLYYRLNIISIRIPPLRERKEDILPLAKSFIARYNYETLRNVKGITDEAIAYLQKYDWPGNVRELQNIIERTMASTWDETLTAEHFRKSGFNELSESEEYRRNTAQLNDESGIKLMIEGSLSEQKEAIERKAILDALLQNGGNKSKAAKMLHISRTLLYKKLEKYNLS